MSRCFLWNENKGMNYMSVYEKVTWVYEKRQKSFSYSGGWLYKAQQNKHSATVCNGRFPLSEISSEKKYKNNQLTNKKPQQAFFGKKMKRELENKWKFEFIKSRLTEEESKLYSWGDLLLAIHKKGKQNTPQTL